uniref:Endo-1,4-beta-xylanase C n=2 Tax=Anthurium amnicola TaxID=1678845 RepID=A0A1D1YQM1_9ARAE
MKNLIPMWVLLFIAAVYHKGIRSKAMSYDYSAGAECLAVPQKAQYSGGLILNPHFDDGLKGWTTFSGGEMEERISDGGNKFAVTHSRNQPYHSLSHKLYLEKGKFYTFSAWLQVNEGNVPITAIFKTASSFTHVGSVLAKSGCWSMLKGGLTVDSSGPAELYFETENATLEVWVDSVSLQPFTEKQWRTHQAESIEKVRKRRVAFTVVDDQGNRRPGAAVTIKQMRSRFPLGSAIPQQILTSRAYQSWFTSRFTVTTFENEMKWYSTEKSQGQVDYSVPDAMLAFAKKHGITVRGHNIFWEDPQYLQPWVRSLSANQLQAAVLKRINSVMSRYRGQVIGWDVVNENLHFAFFESNLGRSASAVLYQKAQQLDSSTPLFLNDYNTIEDASDSQSTPSKYLQKLREMRNGRAMAIGLEGHFHTPNIPYMRSSLDVLARANLPIWLTEVDVSPSANQAHYLEQVLREAYAHPAVEGIIIWAARRPEGCYRMCLTDNEFRNLPTGDVVDKLIREWKTHQVVGTTDDNGIFEAQLFHGDYDVMISYPSLNSSMAQNLKVAAGSSPEETLHVELYA